MDQNQRTLDEKIQQVLRTLPLGIRTYLATGKYSLVAKSLMAKYGLRLDQGGVLEREIMLLLMGIETPDEFVKALTEEAGLDGQAINGITHDVNEKIFVPLRAQMQAGGAPQRVAPRPVNAQVPSYAPPRPPAPTPRPVAPVPTRPIVSAPAQQSSMPSATPARIPTGRDVHSPSLGEILQAVAHPAGSAPAQRVYTPPPRFSTSEATMKIQVGSQSEPPTNLPGAMPPPVPLMPKPPAQSYGTDPYHEPLDDTR